MKGQKKGEGEKEQSGGKKEDSFQNPPNLFLSSLSLSPWLSSSQSLQVEQMGVNGQNGSHLCCSGGKASGLRRPFSLGSIRPPRGWCWECNVVGTTVRSVLAPALPQASVSLCHSVLQQAVSFLSLSVDSLTLLTLLFPHSRLWPASNGNCLYEWILDICACIPPRRTWKTYASLHTFVC